MAKMKRSMVAALALAVVVFGAWLALSNGEPQVAEAQGVEWQDLTMRQALDRAAAEDRRVFVKFDAEWCSYCRKLEDEVLATAEGASITADMIAVTFDFDDEDNRALVEQYVVLGLPTSLVLTADGTQVGRIQGYHGREEWVSELVAATSAVDPVPALRAAHEAAPNDPEKTLRLGEALLVRGTPDEGEALLEQAAWAASETPDVGAEALFVLGRYYHRVRRDPRTARHIWRELAARYPESDWAGGAWWWYAKAEAEIGQVGLGAAILRRRAAEHPRTPGIVMQWGEYVDERSYDDDREAVVGALTGVLGAASDDDERREIEELIAKL
ncbi:MAG: thioredoxin family protein, partial [Deltaproteobacteria bacterium]|nr:thioredoxin family protein [Deltaproteobacteria bacterium]